MPVSRARATHSGSVGRPRRTTTRPSCSRSSGSRATTKAFFSQVERDLRDHLTRSLPLEIPANTDLKLYGRPGESADEFAARCTAFADERADEEMSHEVGKACGW